MSDLGDIKQLFSGPPAPGNENTAWFRRIEELVYMQPFYYLAGPMSGRPGFNFEEFDRVSQILRGQGYLISSPAEYEHEQVRRKIAASKGHEPHDEVGGPSWVECLARDVAVVAHPNCVGVILLRDWQSSRGARLETFVANELQKPLYEYGERPYSGCPVLAQIDRDAGLREAEDPAARLRTQDDVEDEAFHFIASRPPDRTEADTRAERVSRGTRLARRRAV